MNDSFERVASEVLDALHEGCQVVDFDWRYVYVNDAVVEQAKLSREQLIGRTMMDCYPGIEHTPMFAALRRCMQDRAPHRMENDFLYPDGSRGTFELRFLPVPAGVCVLSLDVTADKRTAEQLRQAQKLEAVGRLAGGVAHDFNNLLSVILSYASLVLADMAAEDPVRPDLVEIERAGERAANLTRQLLAFSRQQALEARVLRVDEVVRSMQGMCGRLLGATIEMVTSLGARDATVHVDPGHLEQVLVNLIVNARDAMPAGGKLTLETRVVDLDEEYARAHVGASPGPHVVIAVTDSGSGMDAETQSRVFEPFFTTKQRGMGTGLGLATVFGIVKQNGGHIWLYSEPDRGTTFKVYFPCAAGDADDARPTAAPSSGVHRGSGRILLVEDDEQVRAVASGILQRAGYTVVAASSPGDALLAREQNDAPFDMLLSDVVLPRMNGPELAERLRAQQPALCVLFMSGYTDAAILHQRILGEGAPYLQKPFTPDSLLRKVAEVLRREA